MSIKDRAAGAVIGALIGDALGVGPHWYYDLTQMRRDREPPVPGDMLRFPSWLEHAVDAFQGAGRRTCVAFNVRLTMS